MSSSDKDLRNYLVKKPLAHWVYWSGKIESREVRELIEEFLYDSDESLRSIQQIDIEGLINAALSTHEFRTLIAMDYERLLARVVDRFEEMKGPKSDT
jgi:hypothetical protein